MDEKGEKAFISVVLEILLMMDGGEPGVEQKQLYSLAGILQAKHSPPPVFILPVS